MTPIRRTFIARHEALQAALAAWARDRQEWQRVIDALAWRPLTRPETRLRRGRRL